jgi:hypothetical protein
MKLVADDARILAIPGSGRWLAEQAPGELLAALTELLVPYRDGAVAAASAGAAH